MSMSKADRVPGRMTCVLVAFAALWLAAACGPIQSTPALTRADSAIERALEQRADARAVYEFTLATEYLEKAREEYGYARYRKAARYAEHAREMAEQAERRARAIGAGALDTSPGGR